MHRVPEDFYVCLIPDRMKVEEWRASPAALDHTIPSSNWCAMTLVRMALLFHRWQAPILEELFERACVAGVYLPKEGGGWIGAYHAPLADFLKQLGFLVIRQEGINTVQLAEMLSWGIGFLSVSPDIRFHTAAEPTKRNGHMVLAYECQGLADGSKVFLIQNPAGFASLNSQIGVRISEARLKQVFSGNAIFLARPRIC